MLATVASLDHQSREMISGIAATAEEKLREACAQVFAGVGESLRERLREIAESFASPEPPTRAKGASTGS
jgi:vacuolar-type H+-ATPase subunit E/Vma4